MPYVQRDHAGNIKGVYAMRQEGYAEENLPDDSADVAAYLQLAPTSAKVMTSLAFIELFTPDEQLAITTAAMQSPELRLWYDKLVAADQVIFDDPRLLEGMGIIVAAGLITQTRHDEILSTK